MKIAIASQDKTPQAQTAPNAGRAPYYLIFNDGELEEAMENPFVQGGGGAGPKVAQMLADRGVEKVFLEQLGSNMEMALQDKKIEVELVESGKAEDILSRRD
ncbi:MAG TPA: NifB/NifX family molybdenum-iron cluster-binding protein [Patescibacteria group bacterium]|nr:NifB/NifX family molybdenum-iron cluster-binding protein [Patescibacteria group bacterium]